ncbi:hypothetical protein BCR44DRAFT_1426167 [Catenaria anguillulae PL171]|uniref:Uncharacterized protein n=1 Tax=Catenaria anguillulae PL171 TaxID=765915 RepID=A0A1Y2HNF9_9FUNG|nr:hypothetical protein BCR44DRAFT_1447727 [Catenaria anguillulae PL171]ORZ30297.1 hypothetical protein BCR44DRAFT_1445294 [Catenaria anguillulae PL171]ORZ33514.1 hypothetical protein BCR44DRAFT_1438123 [Catenaria anguillulae PL171]ORZ34665.1 hypothetical protein BCR44DRAFT_1436179 [Catenaria anguillulae PL171]ORZ34672.1 hypothetical protein BCR44DRAFT_1435570 [Catenaria anguillulae PL171]
MYYCHTLPVWFIIHPLMCNCTCTVPHVARTSQGGIASPQGLCRPIRPGSEGIAARG